MFGASHRCTKSEVSTRGISANTSDFAFKLDFVSESDDSIGARRGLAQDLANQVRHWDVYTAKMGEHGLAPGSCLNPLTAEWFSGQQLSSFRNFEITECGNPTTIF